MLRAQHAKADCLGGAFCYVKQRMDPKYYGLIEIGFTACVVLGFGFWQLWSLRRDEKRDRKKG